MTSELRVFSPKNLSEALQAYGRNRDAILYAGGTSLLLQAKGQPLGLEGAIVPLGDLEELKLLSRGERFIDVGAGLCLSDILERGEGIVPPLLLQTIKGIGLASTRSLATIGGNLATRYRRMDLYPVLSCLDSHLELRREGSSRYLPCARLFSQNGECALLPGEIIVRVRLPLASWDLSIVRKLGFGEIPDESTYIFVFLAALDRDLISDLRVSFSGHSWFRNQELEAQVIGRRLPLSRSDVLGCIESYKKSISETMVLPSVRRLQFINLLSWSFDHLCEAQA